MSKLSLKLVSVLNYDKGLVIQVDSPRLLWSLVEIMNEYNIETNVMNLESIA